MNAAKILHQIRIFFIEVRLDLREFDRPRRIGREIARFAQSLPGTSAKAGRGALRAIDEAICLRARPGP